jgi:hypothetical protein
VINFVNFSFALFTPPLGDFQLRLVRLGRALGAGSGAHGAMSWLVRRVAGWRGSVGVQGIRCSGAVGRSVGLGTTSGSGPRSGGVRSAARVEAVAGIGAWHGRRLGARARLRTGRGVFDASSERPGGQGVGA